MSADYDRLFGSPDAVRTVEDEPDRDTPPAGRDAVTPPAMPAAAPRTQAAPPPRQAEVTSQMPPLPVSAPQQLPNNGMMRTPQAPAGARHEQPRHASVPAPRPAPAPAPSQHFADVEVDRRPVVQSAPTSAAS
ncbi:ESX-1 associated ATP-binding protein EpsI N-terminal domain-containing protein, partial [Mycobacterium kyogaense]|uniref:ESX-1 associated ATP-binding protein EpsI N-terminal domain-containing protein n=1 Tax=Mycobacterium kyogaense TaxID=2212479 RepID=UPI003B837040